MSVMKSVGKKEELMKKLKLLGYLKTPRIIEAFEATAREEFVPEKYRKYAYDDEPLPIGSAQTISAPHMNAICTELIDPQEKDKILEIGAGSGYQSAILSKLSKKVISIDLEKDLVDLASRNLSKIGIKNIKVIQGDGSKGFAPEQPYDKILVTCACKEIPKFLIEQLKTGGRMAAPIGEALQTLTLIIKTKEGLEKEYHGGCVFVPLRH